MADQFKEDPLERLERKEREKKARGGSLRSIMIALAVVAALLAAALAYVWIQKSSLVSDLEEEKKDLTEQIVALQSDCCVSRPPEPGCHCLASCPVRSPVRSQV